MGKVQFKMYARRACSECIIEDKRYARLVCGWYFVTIISPQFSTPIYFIQLTLRHILKAKSWVPRLRWHLLHFTVCTENSLSCHFQLYVYYLYIIESRSWLKLLQCYQFDHFISFCLWKVFIFKVWNIVHLQKCPLHPNLPNAFYLNYISPSFSTVFPLFPGAIYLLVFCLCSDSNHPLLSGHNPYWHNPCRLVISISSVVLIIICGIVMIISKKHISLFFQDYPHLYDHHHCNPNDHDLLIKIVMNVKIILPSPVLARSRETPLVRASGELFLFVWDYYIWWQLWWLWCYL